MAELCAGDRVELVHTDDAFTRLRPGDQGTVTDVLDGPAGLVIGIEWDSGSRLSMIPDDGDVIRKVA